MQSPKSIYIAFDVFPRMKGSSSHIALMASALERKHAPVWLLCLGYGDMPLAQEEGDVFIHRYKMYHPNMLRRAVGFMEFVEQKVSEAGDDVELIVFRDPWGGFPALMNSKEGCGTVFEVNALPSRELHYTYPAVSRNRAFLAKLGDMEQFCLRESGRIITVSEVTKEMLAGMGAPPGKISVIQNAASDAFFNSTPEDCPVSEMSEGRWFGYIGSLQPWQGVETALDAFAMAAPDLPDARMLIVHNGRKEPAKLLRKRARKRGIAERVLLRDPMPPEQLAAVIAAMEFTVVPLAETGRNCVQGCCPVKLVESLAAGTPAVASDLRVCRELIADGREGLLVPPGDTRLWAQAIVRMFNEPGLAKRLSENSGKTARERFSTESAYKKLDGVFSGASRGAARQAPIRPCRESPPVL